MVMCIEELINNWFTGHNTKKWTHRKGNETQSPRRRADDEALLKPLHRRRQGIGTLNGDPIIYA